VESQQIQQDIITPQKTTQPQTSTMIQLEPPTKWMTNQYHLIIQDPTIISARQFQNKGSNQEISLLISMVAQKMNNQTQQDGDTNRITGTSLQYHSISTLIKALKHEMSLQELHYKISTNYYPPLTKTEMYPPTIPMLFQSSHHPYTAFDDIDSLSPQDVKYIMTTYCERFYPQATKAMIKELTNSPNEEIKQMMQTPQTI
jgi:hypothetical protein